MKEIFEQLKKSFAGKCQGAGFAQFPTIEPTAYTEYIEFVPDVYKDAIFFQQKTFYRDTTDKNGQTLFWDTGFILFKENRVYLHSAQVGGRIEIYELQHPAGAEYVFNSASIQNDSKSIRSQRIFKVGDHELQYQLNMATHAADFQDHLVAKLKPF